MDFLQNLLYKTQDHRHSLRLNRRRGSTTNHNSLLAGIPPSIGYLFILITGTLFCTYTYASYSNIPIPDMRLRGSLHGHVWGSTTTTQYRTNVTPEMKEESDILAAKRRHDVQGAMLHAWSNYETFAMGKDELLPMSKGGRDNWGGMAMTLVDSLDTLWMMDMKQQFYEARDWVSDHLDYNNMHDEVSTFETTIRHLGGMLSAYELSRDDTFLSKAEDIGGRLLRSAMSYTKGNTIPKPRVFLNEADAREGGHRSKCIADLATLQLEFRYLSKVSGDAKYGQEAMLPFDKLAASQPADGLFPIFVLEGTDEKYSLTGNISFGAMGDSAYEYMLKLWLQSGKTEDKYRRMYDRAIKGLHETLLHRSTPSGLTYVSELKNGKEVHEMEFFVCFAGGMLALGALHDPHGFESPRAQRDFKTATDLTYTCHEMHARTYTGIAGNKVIFEPGADFRYSEKDYDQTHQLRPEFVESLYILYYITGDPMYRDWGWEYFEALEKYSKVEHGYTTVHNVDSPYPLNGDNMESFFLAETLKYLYLLFGGDKENNLLEKYVLNTEAHPLGLLS